MDYQPGAQMVAVSHGSSKVESTQVAPWPEAIDLEGDILKNGKAMQWRSMLKAALRTRKLLSCLMDAPITRDLLLEWNPSITESELQTTLDNFWAKRQDEQAAVAANLLRCVKIDTLDLSTKSKVLGWQEHGSGQDMYMWVWSRTDLRIGTAQDRLRAKYPTVVVAETDSIAVIREKVSEKWFLFNHHTLYNPKRDAKEGLRDLISMLLGGPPLIKSSALTELQALDKVQQVDAEAWCVDHGMARDSSPIRHHDRPGARLRLGSGFPTRDGPSQGGRRQAQEGG